MKWKIVYGDCSTYSDEDGSWEDAPPRKVAGVLFRNPVADGRWDIRHGGHGRSSCDFFRLDPDGSVVGMDLSGLIDDVIYERKLVGPETDLPAIIHQSVHVYGVLKQGRMFSDLEWQRILRFMMMERNWLREQDGSA